MSILKSRFSIVYEIMTDFSIMINRSKALIILSVILSFHLPLQAQQHNEEIDRLTAFAIVAGAIRFFSPTDMIDSLLLSPGWDTVIVKRVQLCWEAKTEKHLQIPLSIFFSL